GIRPRLSPGISRISARHVVGEPVAVAERRLEAARGLPRHVLPAGERGDVRDGDALGGDVRDRDPRLAWRLEHDAGGVLDVDDAYRAFATVVQHELLAGGGETAELVDDRLVLRLGVLADARSVDDPKTQDREIEPRP